jgi:uncharacterized membrane protein
VQSVQAHSVRQFQQLINNNAGSLLRAVIYTIGHFFIAATCVWYFTGASFTAAITDAVVEPLINGLWYFILDRFWAARFP